MKKIATSSRILLGALILLGAVVESPAQAQGSTLPVYVEAFAGPGSRAVRNAVVRVLGQIDDVESISARSAQTRIGVVRLRGEVSRASGGLALDLRVFRSDDSLVGDVQATGRNAQRLARTVRDGLAGELSPLLADARQAPEPEGEPINIVVRDFLGPQAAQVRAEVLSRLSTRSHISVIPVGVPMTRAEDYVRVAQEREIAAFLEGDITASRQGLSLVISARDGRSGEPVAEARFTGENLRAMRAAIGRELWPQLASFLRDAQAPEAVEVESPDTAVLLQTDEDLAELAESRPSPLRVSIGQRLFSRTLEYNDDIFQQLSGYQLGAAASLVFELEWYPLAHFRSGWLAHLGIETQLDSALGLSSKNGDDDYATSATDWNAGLVYRIPIHEDEILVSVAYGQHGFALEDENTIPDTDYQFIRYGLRGRVAVATGLFVEAGFAWRQLFGTGEIDRVEWFPRQTGAGLDASLGLGYQFTDSWGMHASAELRRYFFSLSPAPGDAWIAGGLLDQYWSGSLRLSYRWPPKRGEQSDDLGGDEE
jgi:hypothetical protein